MISCNHYDYIEIVCLYKYEVLLTLKSGESIQGVANDTKRNENKQECILIKRETDSVLVVLDELVRLEVLTQNPKFKLVTF
ncbi:Rho-binding antiterminator [Vibrio sp. 99-70-13A1]|uniref:Rho-binding antiterminator n=1 Tax=Vibrio sp. 99-70-13A1 TaxID=2607601 RepID=UPI001493DDD1|nr:Rho-binding antiterminator [Vibrio sp. 99-70-13A1]NOH95986.1 transcriptional regulator [Vibrio sp. 99-70-13A1]